MTMLVIILSAGDFIEAKMHIGIVLLPVYIILGAMIHIVCSGLLKLFSKETKDQTITLFYENCVRLRKLISMFILS